MELSALLTAGSWGQENVLVPQVSVERTCDIWNGIDISAVSATSTE